MNITKTRVVVNKHCSSLNALAGEMTRTLRYETKLARNNLVNRYTSTRFVFKGTADGAGVCF